MKKRILLSLCAVLLLIPMLCGILNSCGDKEKPAIYISLLNGSSTVTVGTPVEFTVYGRGGVKVDMEEVELSLSNNNCDALLSGTRINSGKAGTCTIYAEYEWKDETYRASYTITFEHPRLRVVVSESDLQIGQRVKLNYRFDPEGIYPYGEEYVTYSAPADQAKIEKEGNDWYLTPSAGGEIEVTLTYANGDLSYSVTDLLSVNGFDFVIAMEGESAKQMYDISLKIESCNIPDFDESKVVYVSDTFGIVIEGNVIKASDKSSISVWATYEYMGVTIKSNVLQLSPENSGNPIRTVEDLLRLKDSDEEFLMLADIDLSGYEDWEPITGFSGTLHGNGHKIYGMTMEVSHQEEDQGLFGLNKGTIINLTVEGTVSSMGEAKYIGILCGNNHGTLRNVTVSGAIDAPYCDYVGGVSGHSNNSSVSGLVSNVRVSARDYVGGVIGYLSANRSSSKVVENLTNNGEIHGANNVGGVFGGYGVHSDKNNDGIQVRKLTNNGVVNGTEIGIGGVFGKVDGNYYKPGGTAYIAYVTVSECKNTATVTGLDEVGGIVGYSGSYVNEVTQCENKADVSGNLYVGGYVGKADGATVRNLKNSQTITGKAYVGGIIGKGQRVNGCENSGTILAQGYHLDSNGNKLSFVGGVAGDVTNIFNCVNHSTVDVSTGGEYVGGIAGRVVAIRDDGSPNSGNKNYGEVIGTKTVGGIAGELIVQDGKNNETVSVSNNTNEADVTGSENYVGGLIGYLRGDYYKPSGTTYISYVSLSGSKNTGDVSGLNYVGGLVGNGQEYVSEISVSENTGDVSGQDYVGGYAGRSAGTTMRLLKNSQTITGRGYVGGIVGYAGKVVECENNGTLSITGYFLDGETKRSYVGGIAGYATGAVKCVNNAAIDASMGGTHTGGIVGYLHADRSSSNTVTGNKNYGEIRGVSYVGGIAGDMTVQQGKNNDMLTVSDNLNEGEIIGSSDRVGGIFGYLNGNYYKPSGTTYTAHVKIMECRNNADVTGANYVGGIIGYGSTYVDKTAAIWDSNSFTGALNTEGANQGNLYGHLG